MMNKCKKKEYSDSVNSNDEGLTAELVFDLRLLGAKFQCVGISVHKTWVRIQLQSAPLGMKRIYLINLIELTG